MFEIYLITNQINEKVYVGQTMLGIRKRWNTHVRDADRKIPRPLYYAMNKYGIKRFAVCLLESELETQEEADAAETKWISRLDSTNPEIGYNLTSGGKRGKFSQEARNTVDKELPLKEILDMYSNQSAAKISDHFGVEYGAILRRLRNANIPTRTNDQTKRANRLLSEGKDYLIVPDRKRIADAYLSGKEPKDLAVQFELNPRNIRKILEEEGIPLRGSGPVLVGNLRVCYECKTPKPFDDMIQNKARKEGIGSYCKPCWQKKLKQWKQSKKETDLSPYSETA